MAPVDVDVCVVGAGFAGLSAARRVAREGRSVVVLEARDRVGGRVWTVEHAGARVDVGGTFLGPGQDAVLDLARDVGVTTYPTFHQGKSVLVHQGRARRYRGLLPPINPIAVASMGLAMFRLDRMAKEVPLDAPWSARRAPRWDARTAGAWTAANIPDATARAMTDAGVRGLMTCDPSEVSLLHFLLLVHAAGGLSSLRSVEGGYQQDMVDGGAQSIADAMATELGDALRVRAPVRAIRQDSNRVWTSAAGVEVAARHAIVAIPPALASDIAYDPVLPADRVQLMERMPCGSVLKTLVFYAEPFWRAEGLSGETVATEPPIETTLDASPASGSPGVVACFAFGPYARAFGLLDATERRRVVLDTLRDRFGPRALDPIDYHEVEWATQKWSRGCYMAHLAPGVLTQFGSVLRTPCGRIHWAGTETSTQFHGTIDGAVRSGLRAADEVLAAG